MAAASEDRLDLERAPQVIPIGALAPALVTAAVFLGFLGFPVAGRIAHRGHATAAKASMALAATPNAELDALIGGVFFTRPAESWQPGRSRQALAEGQRLRSDSTGMAILEVPGVASVLITSGTDVTIDRLRGGTFLRLSRGSVVALVSKRPPGEPFVVLTDRFAVRVVGTLFEVDQDGSGHTAVSVRHGTVEVAAADGTTYRVEAGQSWTSAEPGARGVAAIPDSIEAVLEAGGQGASRADLERQLEAMKRRSAPPSGTAGTAPPVEVDGVARGAGAKPGLATSQRKAGALVSGAPPTASPPPPIVLAEREPALPATRGSKLDLSPGPAPSPVAQAVAPALSSSAVAAVDGPYAEGLALERRGEFGAAAASLAGAAEKDPSHADLALYALGRLYQHRLHDPRQALDAFARYRAGYPHGTLMQEVDLAVLEIDVQTNDRARALAESRRFLAAHPGSERIAEVHALRGNLLREGGDCRAALAEYAPAAASALAFAETALLGIARCQQELGNGPAAREALRAYRTRFPAGPHRGEVDRALAEPPGQEF